MEICKVENCDKLDTCHKIKMVLDHDLLEFQYAEAIHKICAKCNEFVLPIAENITGQLNKYKKYKEKHYPENLKEDDLIMVFLDTHLGIRADMLRNAKLYFKNTSKPIPTIYE